MEARRTHLFPDITHEFLSISMLCNQGYMTIFDKDRVYSIKEGEVLFHGNKNKITHLYIANITPNKSNIRRVSVQLKIRK